MDFTERIGQILKKNRTDFSTRIGRILQREWEGFYRENKKDLKRE